MKAATTAFTFKTLLRHYGKQVLTGVSRHEIFKGALVGRDLLRDYESPCGPPSEALVETDGMQAGEGKGEAISGVTVVSGGRVSLL